VAALFAAATAAAAVAVALSSASSLLPPLPTSGRGGAEAPNSLRRRLLATLEGSLAFNMGQASTVAKFKTVPKGKGGHNNKAVVTKQAAERAADGAAADGPSLPSPPSSSSPPPSFTNNACPLKALNLTRREAEDLGKALMDLVAKNRTAPVQVRGVAVSIGGG
jgi:hypothetical protein